MIEFLVHVGGKFQMSNAKRWKHKNWESYKISFQYFKQYEITRDWLGLI